MNYYLSLAALVPADILFVRIYQLDHIEKEPRRLLGKLVLLGALAAVPAALAQLLLTRAAGAALLAVGLAVMLLYAGRKQGYHVDELYTYELANYPGGFYALEDGYMDTWHDGSFYSAVLTPGRLFDYTIPWNNQKIDVHPPLYYCLIYTAESLFPQLGLPWVGLLPNFVCILAGAAVLYCTAMRLIGRCWPAWTAAACWLLCVGVQGMAEFTRMYSLMLLEGIVLLYCHVVLWQALQAGQKPPRAVWPGLFAVTMAGALTQYFFLVFCFFVCGLFGVWLLAARR